MNYLLDPDYMDKCNDKLQSSIDLIEIDEQFKESYLDIIERFYTLFESIHQYYLEINEFIERVDTGYFMEYNREAIILEKEGKRLMIEAISNYGIMLLLLDRLVPSIARERLVVCYVRYKSASESDLTQQVARMCRGTGAVFKKNEQKIPAKYPVEYFGRFKLDRELVENLINSMKDDDVYSMLGAYPNPLHRSVALSSQAQCMFVLLNFCPRIMEKADAKMREIADKHFPDNFVIPIYQGYVLDITQFWQHWPAAKTAIQNNIYESNVKQYAERHVAMTRKCYKKLSQYVRDGQLLEDFVLDNVQGLLECLRDSNVTVRWLMLHNNARSPSLRNTI